jgi:thiamine pyrophosphokinase
MSKIVVVADGSFPVHEIPLGYLRDADVIVCCDGSAENLVNYGMVPEAIVGDMDSLSEELTVRFADRIYIDESQDTNDLTKAITWCHNSGYNDIVIVGASGKREDHTVGNISLLAEYSKYLNVRMITDTGIFMPYHESCRISSSPGQKVSVFSINPETEITSTGLKYALNKRKLGNWWEATLNEALGDYFELRFTRGPVLVFLVFIAPLPPLKGGLNPLNIL